MPEQTYLVLDFGASNVRVLTGSYNGRTVSFDEIYRFDNRPVVAAGTLYWDILYLLSQMETGIGKAVAERGEIRSIGIDTWGVDFGFIDGHGKLVNNPVNYRDARRNSVSDELFSLIPPERLYADTGMFQLSIMSIFHLFALKKDNASDLKMATRFLMMPDLMNYLLTGETVNEFTNATTTCLYNPTSRKWEGRVLDAMGIDRSLFGETVLPGTGIGRIRKSICEELELPAIPVTAVASHDTASAFAGIPMTDAGRKWAFLSLGTWGVVGSETDHPVITREALDLGIGNMGNADGRTFFARNVTALWITQECREEWMRRSGTEIPFSEIVAAAGSARGFQGFIDVDDPVFGQVQPNMAETIVSSCESRGFRVAEDMGSVARVVYESLVMKFHEVLQGFESLVGYRFELVHVVGGGSRNRLICQSLANLAGIPVVAGPAETTSAGNLIAQLVAAGEIDSFQAGRELVRSSFETVVYQPQKRQEWIDAYSLYKSSNEKRRRSQQ